MYYTFYQNNSGGFVYENTSVANYLIIEASSLKQAQVLAQSFIEDYSDSCPCCGSRWSIDYPDQKDEKIPRTSSGYLNDDGKWINTSTYFWSSKSSIIIHYLDGTFKQINYE